jgi:predicted anti-sigma-YlaC factor YlaD
MRMNQRTETGKSEPECHRIAHLLPALPDGDLDPAEAAEVQAHLEACPECRADAEAMLRVSELLRQDPVANIVLPDGADAAAWILEQDAARPHPWWRWPGIRWAPGLAVATAALAAVLLGGPLRFHHREGPKPGDHTTAPAAPANEPLPALVVVDDEETGRQVLLAPSPSYGENR